MEKNRIQELIAKYNEGLADPSEVKALEELITAGAVDLTELRELDKLHEQLVQLEGPAPSIRMDDQFYSFLRNEKRKAAAPGSFVWPSWTFLAPRLAFGVVLLAGGFAAGYFLQKQDPQVRELTQEVSNLKEMVMLSLLEKESTTDRLRAVSLTGEMGQASRKVTSALLRTLNEDENVNVRLAALEALAAFARDGQVRQELIQSISKQDSPMVQVALAELMVSLQEKKSVQELQRIVESDKTPKEVKSRIQESIKVLI